MINLLNKISIPNDWKIELKIMVFLIASINQFHFRKRTLDNKDISPAIENIFNAFKYCNFESTKVVIFGQDPYFQSGIANSLASLLMKSKNTSIIKKYIQRNKR